MYKLNTIAAVGAALIALSGCTTVSLFPEEANQGTNSVADRPAAAPVDVGINWSWRIVGDEAVRPVQVFDTRGQTFLQMRPQQAQEVVILSNGQVLPFQVSPPYLVLQGTPSQLDVVRDGYRAVLVRSAAQEAAQQPSLASTVPAVVPAPVVEQGSVSRVQRVPMTQLAGQGQILESSASTVAIPHVPTVADEPVASPRESTTQKAAEPQKAATEVPARRGRIQRVSVQ